MDRNGPQWTAMDRNGPQWTAMDHCEQCYPSPSYKLISVSQFVTWPYKTFCR